MNSIAILKTGRYTDANGRTYDITPAVLEDIARNTAPNSAPLVKGHPSSESPSMGWVQGLKVAGNKLLAVFGKIDLAFAEGVKSEAFRPDLSALKEQIRQELLAEFSDAGIVIPTKEEKNQKEASMPDDQRVKELEAQLEASKSELTKEREERSRLAKEAETAQNKAAVSAEADKLGESK